MSSGADQLTGNKLLLAEGKEDRQFIDALLKHFGVTGVQVEEYGGKTNLGRYLRELPLRPGFATVTSIGITRDADASVVSARDSVGTAVREAGLAAAHLGTDQPTPRVAVFLMPNNRDAGMLEDACLQSVEDDPAMSCVAEFFACVLTRVGREPNNRSKARVHAWLATHPKADKRLGEAAEAGGYWRFDHEVFRPLIEFIRAL